MSPTEWCEEAAVCVNGKNGSVVGRKMYNGNDNKYHKSNTLYNSIWHVVQAWGGGKNQECRRQVCTRQAGKAVLVLQRYVKGKTLWCQVRLW